MKMFVVTYLAVACLIGSITGKNVRPLERPGSSLRAGSSGHLSLLGDPINFAKPEEGDAPPTDAVTKDELKEVDDPAAEAEKDAIKAVPKTLAPAEKVPVDKELEEQAKTAAELTGVEPKGHGDWSTMILTWCINFAMIVVCCLVFSLLRLRFPVIYSANIKNEDIPHVPSESMFGWVSASLTTSTEEIAFSTGLDAALLIEFCNMNVKILTIIGLPMVCIMCPLHLFYGGGGIPLNMVRCLGMANVIEHHPWMYYVTALCVNFITIAVVHVIYGTMAKFMRLRYGWLKCLPAPRSTTVLVEGIPQQWRSDAKLKEFFGTLFNPAHIKEAVMVKNVPELTALFEEQKIWREELEEAEEIWELVGNKEDERPMMSESMCGAKVDTIKFCKDKLAELEPKIAEARQTVLDRTDRVGGINTSTGFVTFNTKRQMTLCRNAIFSPHRHEWEISAPPEAADIRWSDLKQDTTQRNVGKTVAYALTVSIYVCFIPLVVLGTNCANMLHFGIFQPVWASFAPGLALMLLLGFLPTVLLLIFRTFFTLKADSIAQHKLQIWYFLFLLFFVVLVTCIGQSLFATFAQVVRRPEDLMWLMAEHLPSATHFYMDFMMLQWTQQATNFLRAVNLVKFLLFSKVMGHEDHVAKDLAEPEDQDYYGIGSRSARFTVNMLIGIIFASLSPLISLFALVLFILCRLFYGYLVVFAETKKPDLGGVFFYTQMQHIFLGTGLYNVLMIGVLFCRARTKFPMLICLPALAYTISSYRHFTNNFHWEDLPFAEESLYVKEGMKASGLCYVQPELMTEDQLKMSGKTHVASIGRLATPRFLGEDPENAMDYHSGETGEAHAGAAPEAFQAKLVGSAEQ